MNPTSNSSATHGAMNDYLQGVTPLPHYGVIKIEGEEAAKFIHGQLTQDFSLLGPDQARLAAFCSPKGRMLASFIGLKRPDGTILLVCNNDILAPALKRLSMFVLRAKARLADASAEYALYGVAGDATKNVAGGAHSAWGKLEFGSTSIINLYPSNGVPRQLWVVPQGDPPPQGTALAISHWQWSEVHSGIAMVSAAVVEAFVPQMLNYESVGGVSFKKGCYPGQEVVARSQFRGTLKRRAFVMQCPQPLKAGDEIFSAQENTESVGTVVQAAAAVGGGFDAIVSAQISAVDSGTLHLGSPAGAQLTVLPLPYPLLNDI